MTAGKLPVILLLATVIVLAGSLVQVQEAKAAATWIIYDDGPPEEGGASRASGILAVRFSLPLGVSSAKILTARYYITAGPTSFKVHIFDIDQVTDLTPPFTVTPSGTGWFDVDLTAKNIVVARDFYIAIEYSSSDNPVVGADTDNPQSRSYGGPLSPPWTPLAYNLMIRAYVLTPTPVGGYMVPVNKLAILSPYIALIGLVGAVTVAVATKRRRKT